MSPLTVLGQFTASLTSTCFLQAEYICGKRDLKRNLLGLPAITSLNLVSKLDSLQLTTKEVQRQYPQLFRGLGTFGEEYEVSLRRDARLFALHTARNVPLPLRKKVQDELKQMESLGVISPAFSVVCKDSSGPKTLGTSTNMCGPQTS